MKRYSPPVLSLFVRLNKTTNTFVATNYAFDTTICCIDFTEFSSRATVSLVFVIFERNVLAAASVF